MYNPTYTRSQLGTFNKEKNMASVWAGTDAYLLEDEVNEMQWIQNETRASIIRKLIQSGHHKVGQIQAGLTSILNAFIVGEQITFVNGYEVPVMNNNLRTDLQNTIQLIDPPTSGTRQDLVFLETWFAPVSGTGYIYEYGGVDSGTMTNDIIQSRIGAESSRRVQLRWRIRIVSGVNTSTYPDGISDTANVFAWAQAGKNTTLNYVKSSDDSGLYIAGSGSQTDIDNLGSIDGFAYAIPMFIVSRLNSGTYDATNNPNGAPLYNTSTPVPSPRPDGKYSDVIYSDQIQDKRNISQTTILNYFKDTGNGVVLNNGLTVDGDLTVNGSTISMNTTEMDVSDSTIRLNSGFTGTPTLNAGIEVERGNSPNTELMWNESAKAWQATNDGSNYYNILLSNLLAVAGGIATLQQANGLIPWNQMPQFYKSSTLVVSSDVNYSDYRDIQSAINALPTTGGTIYVREGTYAGNLTLKSNVNIVGMGYSTIIQMPNASNADQVINVSNVTNARISSFKIDCNKANQTSGLNNGIYLSSSSYVKIDNVSIENSNGAGVYFDTGTSNAFKDSIVKNSAYGVHDYGDPTGATQNGNEISSNKIESCTTGIQLDANATSDIATNNILRGCTTGIVNSGANNVVNNNVTI